MVSIGQQNYPFIEHIIIDGGSSDGSLGIIKKLMIPNSILLSEPDEGIYDALNKGVLLASGDVVGILHSDDFLVDESVLTDVAIIFSDPLVDAVYGDLEYVGQSDITKVIRFWRAGKFSRFKMSWGWMPPHPALFIRRSVYDRLGLYDVNYKISADYEAILRFFYCHRIVPFYFPRTLVRMRLGGESNKSILKILIKTKEDYLALRSNNVGGFGSLFWKNISKIKQFLPWIA
jgi:glycosyltransferase